MSLQAQGDQQGSAGPAATADRLGAGDGVPTAFATTPGGTPFAFVAPAQPPSDPGSLDVAALTAGSKWSSVDGSSGATIVTYSFASPQTSTFAYSDFASSLMPFSAADQALTRAVLANIEAVCDVRFVEVPDDATVCGVVRYGYSQQTDAMHLAGYAYFPSPDPRGGDVWLGANMAAPAWDQFRPELILHETLHALGLKHPFEGGVVLPTTENVITDTVMSYSPVVGSTGGTMSAYPTQPMPFDVAALQFLYGAAPTALGDTHYDLADPQFLGGFSTIDDAGGHDVLDAGRLAGPVSLDLNEGARSDVGASVTAAGVVNGSMVVTTYIDTLAIAPGSVVEDAIGTARNDSITGNAAANELAGGGGNDFINGGAGLDRADFSGPHAAYGITQWGGMLVVADGEPGRDGTDTLANVERLHFSDGYVAFDTSGAAGEAYRLYQAAFDRAPDTPGLGFWIRALDNGAPLQQIAGDFVNSPEFAQKYGSLDTVAFVTQLYANVLHRAPDPGGLAFHVGHLESGALTRADVLSQFSESPENQAALIGTIQNGMFYNG